MSDLILEGKSLRTDSSALRSGESTDEGERQRPACKSGPYSGGMSSCLQLKWLVAQAMEREMTPAQIAVLAILMGLQEGDRTQVTKAQLGALVGLKERQVSNVLRELEEVLSLIQKQRSAGSGKGRAANGYLVRPDSTGNPVPATWRHQQSSTGTALPVTNDNQHSNTGTGLPVACGEVLAPIEHGRARGEIKPSYLRGRLELNPDTAEPSLASAPALVLAASSDTPPPPAWQQVCDAVRSPWLDPNKSAQLVLTGHLIDSLIRSGCDLELDIIPTVRRVMGSRRSPVKSFAYFVEAVREDAGKRRAAEQPLEIITPSEFANDQSRPAQSADNIRRGKLSPASAILMRQMSGGH